MSIRAALYLGVALGALGGFMALAPAELKAQTVAIDNDDIGVFGRRCQFGSSLRQHAHHDLAIDEVLGAAEAHEADLDRRRPRPISGTRFCCWHRE